jgi:RNA-directed DNA polymerase
MSREIHVRFCEGVGVRFPRATRPLILKKSKSAAANALLQATSLLETDLKLTVNREKTKLVHARDGVAYLGVLIRTQSTAIQPRRLLTRRNSPVNLEQVIKLLNPRLRGFANYFRVANCKSVLRDLMGWVRRRLRSKTAEALEETRTPSPPFTAVGLQGEISSGQHVALEDGGEPTGKLRYAKCRADEAWSV